MILCVIWNKQRYDISKPSFFQLDVRRLGVAYLEVERCELFVAESQDSDDFLTLQLGSRVVFVRVNTNR